MAFHICPNTKVLILQINMFNPHFDCPVCGHLHAIRQCRRFLAMNVERRLRVVADNMLCSCCLAQSHGVDGCRSLDRCKRCFSKHNSMLHPLDPYHIWFKMTALVRLFPRARTHSVLVRVVMDPNAARSSIVASEVRRFGCDVVNNRTTVRLCHRNIDGEGIKVSCAVENTPVHRTPPHKINYYWRGNSEATQNRNADPMWFAKAPYYIVLGADVFTLLVRGRADGRPGQTLIQETIFGTAYFGEAVKDTQFELR